MFNKLTISTIISFTFLTACATTTPSYNIDKEIKIIDEGFAELDKAVEKRKKEIINNYVKDITKSIPFPPKNISPYQLSASEENMLKKSVNDLLKDPTSSIYSSIKTAEINGTHLYSCGYVNAKNSYGGYTGKSLFFAHTNKQNSLNNFVIELTDDNNSWNKAIATICSKLNLLP